MLSCPCGDGRLGCFLLAAAVYWLSLAGVSPMIAQVEQGAPAGIIWLLMAAAGGAFTFIGLAAALSHDDAFRADSFIWSVFVIAFCLYALLYHWGPIDSADGYHAARGIFWGWAASHAFNIWLQLRGSLGRRQPVTAMPEPHQPRPRPRASVTWLEELEFHSIEDRHGMPAEAWPLPGHVAPPVIEPAASVPHRLQVKQGNAFVPVRRPAALPAVRRLR